MPPQDMTLGFRRLLIMAAGITTTAATLLLVATGVIDFARVYHRVLVPIPTGALMLGVLAGSGYSLAGWRLTGLRFTPAMLKAIVVLMIAVCFATVLAEYGQHAPDGMGFIDYYQLSTEYSTLDGGGLAPDFEVFLENAEPKALGAEGYKFRTVEFLGQMLGGLGGLFLAPIMRALGRSLVEEP